MVSGVGGEGEGWKQLVPSSGYLNYASFQSGDGGGWWVAEGLDVF